MTSKSVAPDGEPLSVLFERDGLPRLDLPEGLVESYGAGLGFERPRVIANFVSSVDGVVAFPDRGESGHVISGGNAADRFVMGLLRACADTVLVGAGTFGKTPGVLFTAEAIYPAGRELFAEARRRLGLSPVPRFVVVSGSGTLPLGGPALRDAVIVTTHRGEAVLASRVAAPAQIVVVDSDPIRLGDVLPRLVAEPEAVDADAGPGTPPGPRRSTGLLLTEGGPSLFGELVRDRLVDELFLTTSPTLFGRFPTDHRKALADGVDLGGTPLELLSLRRHRSYLFARYAVSRERGKA